MGGCIVERLLLLGFLILKTGNIIKFSKWKMYNKLDGKISANAGISASSLCRWVNEYDEYGESAFPGHGNALSNSTYGIEKLQKENEGVRMENEALKNTRPS